MLWHPSLCPIREPTSLSRAKL